MFDNINILKIASAMARHASERHQVIAQNIANADTADFKAKDLEPFSDAFQRESRRDSETSLRQSAGRGTADYTFREISTRGFASPNGNTVSLEDQMIRSVEAQADHEAATTIYKKSIDILRTSLGRGA